MAVLAAVAGCAGPKEAENPRDLLGGDLTHQGVYGGGTAPDTPGGTGTANPPAAGTPARPANALATRADCEAAARHLVALGIELAIRAETDTDKKQRMIEDRKAALESERARGHRAEWTKECLESGTLASEARCIARIRNEQDIDRCVGLP